MKTKQRPLITRLRSARILLRHWRKSLLDSEKERAPGPSYGRVSDAVAHELARYDAADAAIAEAMKPSAWVPMHERVPAPETTCVVWVRYTLDSPGFATVDRWDVQREDPTGMGGPTIATGYGWNDNDECDVLYWIALPETPDVSVDPRNVG